MPTLIKSLLLLPLAFITSTTSHAQTIPAAPEDKAVIYFVRPAFIGWAITFNYYDSTRYIGGFGGMKYMRYECTPGEHLFWATSENRSFIEANVEAGKIYFVKVKSKSGTMKARVELVPIGSDDDHINKMAKYVSGKPGRTFSSDELAEAQPTRTMAIRHGLMEYKKLKEKGRAIKMIYPSMYYTVQ